MYFKGVQHLIHKKMLSKVAENSSPSMAKVISITNTSSEALAIEYLISGSVIAVPTDTVYGLACDATNTSAINRLYDIKCRNENKPLAICLGDINDVRTYASVCHLPQNLLQALFPGAVTLVLNCYSNKLDRSLCLNGKVGIRIPDYPFIRHLATGLGKPLALTSANLSNESSAVELSGFRTIWKYIPVIFDGGDLGLNHSASTVVDLSEQGTYQIIREGVVQEETINILEKFGLKIAKK